MTMTESDKPDKMTITFNVSYDRRTDVLYISTVQGGGSDARMDKQGIVWRYDEAGELVGATIMDFYDRWGSQQPKLVAKLSKRFHLPEPQASVVVDHALSLRRPTQ